MNVKFIVQYLFSSRYLFIIKIVFSLLLFFVYNKVIKSKQNKKRFRYLKLMTN